MLRGFRGELFTAKKEPMKFWTRAFKTFCTLYLRSTAVKEALERKQDLTMSIYRYLRPVNSLPHPNGPLTSSLPPVAIKEANKSLEAVYSTQEKRKRGTYDKLTPEQQLAIVKYAALHGTQAAVRSSQLAHNRSFLTPCVFSYTLHSCLMVHRL